MNKFDEWKKEVLKKNKVKSYEHVDRKIDFTDEKKEESFLFIKEKIKNLKTHQFLPFIKRTDIHFRYRRDECSCGNLEKNIKCTKDCLYRTNKKKTPKPRPIMYASHTDSYIYSYYNYIISEKYENRIKEIKIDNNITAYRSIKNEGFSGSKCNIHFANEAFLHIGQKRNCAVITADIKGFFDNLDHGLLKKNLHEILKLERFGRLYKVFKSLTKFYYIDYYTDFKSPDFQNKLKKKRYKFYLLFKEFIKQNKKSKGIPQGSPISGLLSNIYMYKFDKSVIERHPGIFYRRYSDDILIVCEIDKKDEIKNFLLDEIKNSNLLIESSKTNIAIFKDGKCVSVEDAEKHNKRRRYVDYLGFEFYGDKTLMRKRSLGKLRFKQTRKAKRMVRNSYYKPKQSQASTKVKRESKYLIAVQELFNFPEIKRQINTLSKKRNHSKRKFSQYLKIKKGDGVN